jgi:hypothetical protein
VGAGHRGGERKSGRCVSAASYRMRGMARAWAEHARGTLCQAGFEKPTIVGVWFYWWPCRTDGDCAGQGVAKEAAARSVPSSLRPYRGGQEVCLPIATASACSAWKSQGPVCCDAPRCQCFDSDRTCSCANSTATPARRAASGA